MIHLWTHSSCVYLNYAEACSWNAEVVLIPTLFAFLAFPAVLTDRSLQDSSLACMLTLEIWPADFILVVLAMRLWMPSALLSGAWTISNMTIVSHTPFLSSTVKTDSQNQLIICNGMYKYRSQETSHSTQYCLTLWTPRPKWLFAFPFLLLWSKWQ